jgi:hypothetical protein
MRERATELEWLRYFAINADFGPAHGDVYENLQLGFMEDSGKNLPEGWEYGQDGETSLDQE